MFIAAVFPSPLSIARRGSSVPQQVNNSTSVWSRLRAMNMSVSNFMSSTKILPTKLTIPQRMADACADGGDDKQDIERCVSMPNMKQEYLQSTHRSA